MPATIKIGTPMKPHWFRLGLKYVFSISRIVFFPSFFSLFSIHIYNIYVFVCFRSFYSVRNMRESQQIWKDIVISYSHHAAVDADFVFFSFLSFSTSFLFSHLAISCVNFVCLAFGMHLVCIVYYELL